DDSFDCVVSVGVSGYMSPGTIGEFVRVVRPGGVIVYTISDGHYEENGFKPTVMDLVDGGQLEIVEVSEEFASIPKSEPSYLARVHVYKKL
ncbi:MAG: class I SAM-dependent methyltransferase, partial [Pseudomonadota bacterium]